MKQLHSILAVVGRDASASGVVAKAVRLARQFGARLELFLCEADVAYELAHSYDSTGTEAARQCCVRDGKAFLEQLKDAAGAADLDIRVDAQCASPLYEVVARKVLQACPDLVIKGVSGSDLRKRSVRDPNDWLLMRACPTALMLATRRNWHEQPRVAAAVELSEREPEGLSANVLDAARAFAWGWDAPFDVVNSEPLGENLDHRRDLRKLCEENRVATQRVHFLKSEPEAILPVFAARQDYDVLVIGALSQKPVSGSVVGTLTSRLLDTLDCDFVLVKPAAYQCPIGIDGVARTERLPQQELAGSSP